MTDAKLASATVVIVGGGVTGLSAGWWLTQAGVNTLVVEKGVIGWEASGRNGGSTAHPFSPLFAEEQRLWPEMDERLGYPTEYRPHRARIALTEAQMQHYLRIIKLAEAQGCRWESLDAQQLKELAPLAGDNAIGGVFLYYGGHANPQRTVQAYAWALQDLGGRILQNTTVVGIERAADKVRSVLTSRGRIECDHVVLAAGPQGGQLARMVGVELPMAPARVEMLVTEPLPLMRYGGVDGNGLYGRQTLRGNLTYGGGPHEWLGLDGMGVPPRTSTYVSRSIARRLAELFPDAAKARVIRTWAGIVENTPDGRPVLSRLDEPTNVTIATLSSVGFGLSPASGRAIAELVQFGRCSFADLSALGIDRFRNLPRDWRSRMGWDATAVPSSA